MQLEALMLACLEIYSLKMEKNLDTLVVLQGHHGEYLSLVERRCLKTHDTLYQNLELSMNCCCLQLLSVKSTIVNAAVIASH
jgi:hypothetical protein